MSDALAFAVAAVFVVLALGQVHMALAPSAGRIGDPPLCLALAMGVALVAHRSAR